MFPAFCQAETVGRRVMGGGRRTGTKQGSPPSPSSMPPLSPSSPISQKAGGRRATTAATDLRPILRTLFHRRAGCSLRVLQPCDLPHGAPLLPPPH